MTQKAADDILKNRIVFGLFIGEQFLYQLVVYPISPRRVFEAAVILQACSKKTTYTVETLYVGGSIRVGSVHRRR
jgi:hypothetical protein